MVQRAVVETVMGMINCSPEPSLVIVKRIGLRAEEVVFQSSEMIYSCRASRAEA